MNPFFSIIVVSYNAENLIGDTIESVLIQSFTDYEIIVKDAQSKDDTLKRIPKSDKIRLYSTKDDGIYDGMNEAIGYSSGKYVCFLNCGDLFKHKDVLQEVYAEAIKYDQAVVYGDYSRKEVIYAQPSTMDSFTVYRSALCHQTMFFSKNLFEIYGMYNTKYKIKADYDFTVKTVKAGVKYAHIPCVICKYEGGGVSEQTKSVNAKEEKEIYDSHFSKQEQIKYETILFFTFRKLRQCLTSDRTPKFIRKLYRGFVNKVNKK